MGENEKNARKERKNKNQKHQKMKKMKNQKRRRKKRKRGLQGIPPPETAQKNGLVVKGMLQEIVQQSRSNKKMDPEGRTPPFGRLTCPFFSALHTGEPFLSVEKNWPQLLSALYPAETMPFLASVSLSAASPECTASSDSVVANPSSTSAPGRSSVVSVITNFMMSDEPFCTCTSKLPARTSFRVRRLYRHCHVYHSINLSSLWNLYRLLDCANGWCLVFALQLCHQ